MDQRPHHWTATLVQGPSTPSRQLQLPDVALCALAKQAQRTNVSVLKIEGEKLDSYIRMNALQLPSNVGTSSADGFRISTGEAGALTYGPYISLDRGRYIAGFYIRRIGQPELQEIILDVSADGSQTLISKAISYNNLFEDISSFVYLSFELPQLKSCVEVRLHVADGVLIEVQDLVIFKANQRNWSVS